MAVDRVLQGAHESLSVGRDALGSIVSARRCAMPRSWRDKRERQYEHIKDSYEERGRSEDKAEEIAARTVNKTRAEKGEAKGRKSRSK